MSSMTTGWIVFACLFGGALLGTLLRKILHDDHLSSESKDSVKLAMGLVATMTALLLGLLVSSAKDNYDTQRRQVIEMAAKVTFLDRLLTMYGPEAAGARKHLRDVVTDPTGLVELLRLVAFMRYRPTSETTMMP